MKAEVEILTSQVASELVYGWKTVSSWVKFRFCWQKKKSQLKPASGVGSSSANSEAVSGTDNLATDEVAEGECLAADEADDTAAEAIVTHDSNDQVKNNDAGKIVFKCLYVV